MLAFALPNKKELEKYTHILHSFNFTGAHGDGRSNTRSRSRTGAGDARTDAYLLRKENCTPQPYDSSRAPRAFTTSNDVRRHNNMYVCGSTAHERVTQATTMYSRVLCRAPHERHLWNSVGKMWPRFYSLGQPSVRGSVRATLLNYAPYHPRFRVTMTPFRSFMSIAKKPDNPEEPNALDGASLGIVLTQRAIDVCVTQNLV